MKIDDLMGMEVIDNTGKNVGKISDYEFDEKSGCVKSLDIKLNKGIFSHPKETVTYSQIANI